MTNPFYRTETGWATAPMGAPTAHAVTTHSAHFPAYQLCQQSEGASPPYIWISGSIEAITCSVNGPF
ncbi:TPA: hypothetical protein P0N84_002251 [Yersinia enterocolitica]|nr:hypothetical protein [Yersinia enterocolitica]HDM8319831.1 hypothetical protein [Yersinia enterocolitica]